MLPFDEWFGIETTWGNGLWTLGCLIAVALLLAAVREHVFRAGKKPPEPKPKNPLENPPPQNVNRIASPQRVYEMIDQTACGDLCDIQRAKSGAKDYLLKITQVPTGKPLLLKEFSILEHLHLHAAEEIYREFFPPPVESFPHNNQQINAYHWREGFFTAEQIFDRHHQGLDGRHLGWMFNRVLEALGFVHQQGWIHGAVLPPHLMFHAENHGFQLIGWIHAEKPDTTLKIAPERFKDWYPPECLKKHPATPSVDIYLAAKSLIYLAGGDPVANVLPSHLPPKLQRFVKGCLLESPRMRSQSAWDVRQEFGELLEGLYGPPAFHPLEMS